MTEVARLIVGADEPRQRIVESRLGDIDHRHGDACAGARPAIGLTEVRPAGLLQPLDRARRIGQPGLGESRIDHPSAAFEHAEDISRRGHLPGRQRVELGERALLIGADKRRSEIPYDEFQSIRAGRDAVLLKVRGASVVTAVPRPLFTDEDLAKLRARIA